jgi:hypothetical protein
MKPLLIHRIPQLAVALFAIATSHADTVLHLRFDTDTDVEADLPALSVLDTSGEENQVTPVNSPLYSADTPAPTVPLTGASNAFSLHLMRTGIQRLVVSDDDSLDFGPGSSFTIEAFVRLDTVGSSAGGGFRQYLVHKKSGNNADSRLNYGFLVASGNVSGGNGSGRQLALQLGDGMTFSTIYSDLEITDTDWHYVAVRYNDVTKTAVFTLDGFSNAKTTTQSIAANGLDLLIGAHQNASGQFLENFDGKIDELRISNVFLANADLLSPLTTGSFSTWATDQGVTGGADGDSDHDGISNLLEYALELNPDGTDGSPGFFADQVLSFNKRPEAVDNGDVIYSIETSATLAEGSWVAVPEDSPDLIQTAFGITYFLPSSNPGLFVRLVVTQLP